MGFLMSSLCHGGLGIMAKCHLTHTLCLEVLANKGEAVLHGVLGVLAVSPAMSTLNPGQGIQLF